MPTDLSILIPVVKREDPRYTRRGDVSTPVVNLRMQISLTENPGFALDLGGREAAWAAADLIRKGLSENFQRGCDARGSALPAIALATEKRRARRQMQCFVGAMASLAFKVARGKRAKARAGHQSYQMGVRQRFLVRGKSPSGKRDYRGPVDLKTPFHESGLASENVAVFWKGFNKTTGVGHGDPTFDIAWPTGGRARGLHTDDGRGARLFAVQHYGFAAMADIPSQVEAGLDQMLDNYLSRLLLVGRAPLSVLRQLGEIGEGVAAVAEEAIED